MSELYLYLFFIAVITVSICIVILAALKLRQVTIENRQYERIKQLSKQTITPVTVLIYAKNKQEAIRTLDTVRASAYARFDVVIIYEGNDRVKRGEFGVPVLHRRVQGLVHEAYKAGYRKSKRGTVVITLRAGDEVDQDFIARCVVDAGTKAMWRTNHSATGWVFEQITLTSLIDYTQGLLWHKSKSAEVFSAQYFNKVALLDSICISKHTAKVLGSVLSAIGIIAAISFGFIQDDFMFLWYVWLLFTAYVLAVVWLDIKDGLVDKLRLTLIAPSVLFLLPIASCVRGISQLYKRK